MEKREQPTKDMDKLKQVREGIMKWDNAPSSTSEGPASPSKRSLAKVAQGLDYQLYRRQIHSGW